MLAITAYDPVMTWRAARSLLVLHAQLAAGAPRAAPPATPADAWGLIGDAEHDPTSDHTPHDFAGWGSQIVTAADFPNRPDLGLDAHKVLDDIRRARDPRAKYGISNSEIFSNHPVTERGHSYDAWTWRPYYGDDQHKEHGHLSVVGDARADGTQPWPTIGGTEMANAAEINASRNSWAATQLIESYEVYPGDQDGSKSVPVKNPLAAAIKQLLAAATADQVRDDALAAAVKALAIGSGIDADGLMERVEAAIADAVKPLQARNEMLAKALAAAGGALGSADD